MVQQYLDDGYGVYYVAGISGAGKSELIQAFHEPGYPSPTNLSQPAAAGFQEATPVAAGRRKVVLVDSSGVDLEALRRVDDEAPVEQLDLLRPLAPRLRGLLLTVDMPRLAADGERQAELLALFLLVIRWLRAGGTYDPEVHGAIGFREAVIRDVLLLPRRLPIPVAVVFTRADEAHGVRLPAVDRPLFPVGEDPLLLAYHGLPRLFAALRTHVSHFRFDITHAFVADPDTGEVMDPAPCGIHETLSWLLDGTWRWPALPSRTWLDLSRFVDEKLLRRDVWQRLPEPAEVD